MNIFQISFGLARVLFPNQPALQLGLFFTGCSPGGGASNIWTVALNGNLDLSITMTAISTFASFGNLIQRFHKKKLASHKISFLFQFTCTLGLFNL